MTELLVEFRKCFVRIVLLYIALPAAVVCGAALALWRIVDAFARNAPLEITPGFKIKLP